jgi:alkanesulfonate monooxygenase SsuD/methylene tetrahydromethanopterin reductase-like flavin-dependent oxidoreductase (luciferase family)
VALLRRLWTETSVTVAGEREHVTGAGIAPLPVQRPIPVWIGALADVVLRRAGLSTVDERIAALGSASQAALG